MQVRWSARATADFDTIFEYIARDSESAAITQARHILSATRQLEQFPESGRQLNAHGVRQLFIPHTPYILRYSLKRGVVELVSITHGAMRGAMH